MSVDSRLVAEFFFYLKRRGIKLSSRGVSLRVTAPLGVVSDQLKTLLVALRAELIMFLTMRSPCDRCGAIGYKDFSARGGEWVRRGCAWCGRTKGFYDMPPGGLVTL